ncbi:hypothetical protein DFS34DRAFT_617585 [Phlyctochytrium arcticum]|nr:hypothetical protein DFS34DRAFT_617585 [Phlyctochytrium arcticum]
MEVDQEHRSSLAPLSDSDDDGYNSDEWETEEQYIVMDLGPDVSADSLKDAASKFGGVSMTGLESETPYLRVGNLYFEGAFDVRLGTDMIFAVGEDDENRTRRAPAGPMPLSIEPSRPAVSMDFMGQSTLIMKFKPVTLEPLPPKSASPPSVGGPAQEDPATNNSDLILTVTGQASGSPGETSAGGPSQRSEPGQAGQESISHAETNNPNIRVLRRAETGQQQSESQTADSIQQQEENQEMEI